MVELIGGSPCIIIIVAVKVIVQEISDEPIAALDRVHSNLVVLVGLLSHCSFGSSGSGSFLLAFSFFGGLGGRQWLLIVFIL